MASEETLELVAKLQAENASLKNELEFMRGKFRELELEEEHITNQLLKRLEEKKREKELLLQQVEQEEEYLTNTLQQKLLQLRKEKVEMENQLEQEEEFLTNKLQKMLDEIISEKNDLEKKLEESESARDKLKKEVEEYRHTTQSELNTTKATNQRYRIQLKKLTADNFVLSQKVNTNQEKLDEIKKEKFLLEADMDIKNENEVNALRKKRGRSISCHVPTQQPMLSTSVPKTKPIQIARYPVADQDDDIFPGSFGSVGSFGSFGSLGSFGGNKSNPLSIPSKDKSFPQAAAMSSSPANSILSNSYMESFIHSRSPTSEPLGSSRKCIKRGWLKTLQSDDSWSLSMFVVHDNGDLLCCSSESGVTVKINLDTVLAIIDRSKFVYDIGRSYPPYTFELKTKFCSYFVSCETEKEYQEWTELLEELSPLC